MKWFLLLMAVGIFGFAGCESYSREQIEDCGDSTCDMQAGENPCNCPEDCLDDDTCCEDSDCPDLRCGPCCDNVCEEYSCISGYRNNCCWNGVCEEGENPENCPEDCTGDSCGDGTCDSSAGEDPCTCPADCMDTGACCEDADCPDLPCGLCCGPACRDHACVTVTFEDCCGNGECEVGESNQSCPQDCPGPCGNGHCDEQAGEDPCTCPADCLNGYDCCEDADCPQPECGPCCVARCDALHVCGVEWLTDCCWNGVCEQGETPDNCPEDCGVEPCGDGQCDPQVGEDPCTCPVDCLTADSCCQDADCPTFDCGPCCVAVCNSQFRCEAAWLPDCCWNNICEEGEDPCTCPADCGVSVCGDGICCSQEGEDTCSCPSDCGMSVCGDGICCPPDENSNTCAADCPPGCVPEGGIPGTDEACCPPLEVLNSNYVTSDGECLGAWCWEPVCASCGDGVCGIGENYCSCPDDCGNLVCLHEYGMSMLADGSTHDCCPGLTPVLVPGTDCTQYTCVDCGDGVCGLFETPANCSDDCG